MNKILYKNIFSGFLAVVSLLLFSGCNSDIFIPDSDVPPQEVKVSLEGDGGEASFRIPSKGLKWWGPVMDGNERYNCLYYNKDGEQLDSYSPASEVARILYRTVFESFELFRDGDEVRIKSYSNTYSAPTQRYVNFEYDYMVCTAVVEIAPGSPLRLVSMSYSDMDITGGTDLHRFKTSYSNNGDTPVKAMVRPYAEASASLLVTLDFDFQQWAASRKYKMKVPAYENGTWVMKEQKDITLNNSLSIPFEDNAKEVEVEIPANSKVDVLTEVSFSRAVVSGMFDFYNSLLDLHEYVWFTTTSVYPVSYEISIKEEK